MSMKRTRGKRGFAARFRSALGRLLKPHNAFPCVGLVVLGGCLTMIAVPDEPATDKPARAADHSRTELPTIVLDPGHGGRDEGTKWHGVAEKELTLDVAKRTERLLKTAGFETVMTRRSDTFVPLQDRADFGNGHRKSIFVSIHFNSDSTAGGSGIETYFAREKLLPASDWSWIGFFNKGEPVEEDHSESLAGAIQTSLVTRTEAKNRGIHPSNFFVVRRTRCPAVLVE